MPNLGLFTQIWCDITPTKTFLYAGFVFFKLIKAITLAHHVIIMGLFFTFELAASHFKIHSFVVLAQSINTDVVSAITPV